MSARLFIFYLFIFSLFFSSYLFVLIFGLKKIYRKITNSNFLKVKREEITYNNQMIPKILLMFSSKI